MGNIALISLLFSLNPLISSEYVDHSFSSDGITHAFSVSQKGSVGSVVFSENEGLTFMNYDGIIPISKARLLAIEEGGEGAKVLLLKEGKRELLYESSSSKVQYALGSTTVNFFFEEAREFLVLNTLDTTTSHTLKVSGNRPLRVVNSGLIDSSGPIVEFFSLKPEFEMMGILQLGYHKVSIKTALDQPIGIVNIGENPIDFLPLSSDPMDNWFLYASSDCSGRELRRVRLDHDVPASLYIFGSKFLKDATPVRSHIYFLEVDGSKNLFRVGSVSPVTGAISLSSEWINYSDQWKLTINNSSGDAESGNLLGPIGGGSTERR